MARFVSGPRPFNSCPDTRTPDQVGKRTAFPIGVDKDTYYKWRFRAKKWKCSIDYTCSGSVSSGSSSVSVNCPGSPQESVSGQVISGDESNYSCSFPTAFMGGTDQNDFDSVSNEDSFANASASIFLDFSSVSMQFLNTSIVGGDTYYPTITFSVDLSLIMSAFSDSGFVDVSIAFTTEATPDPVPPTATSVDIPINVDGVTGVRECTLYEDVYQDGSASYSSTVTINSITLTIDEYWGYDGIWDTTDGSQILDPFNP